MVIKALFYTTVSDKWLGQTIDGNFVCTEVFKIQ